MSSEKIPPAEFAAKGLKYPSVEEVKHKINRFTQKIIVVDAARLAKDAGSSRAQNSVLLGTLASVIGFPVQAENLVEALKQLVPAKQVETNVKAFNLGYKTKKEREIG
jgi:indolepyruvate ferredoxin oxidoreductase beta subunit